MNLSDVIKLIERVLIMWINVKDELPDPDESVLAKCPKMRENGQTMSHKDFESLLSAQKEAVKDAIEEINNEKAVVIERRLHELDIKSDWKVQQGVRFPKFIVEYDDFEETYWYNDGSDNGLKIATFRRMTQML